MNDEQDVKRLLDLAVRPEPPLRLDRDAVLGEGRRRLRVRRTAAVGGAATAVAAVVIGMTALSGANFGMPAEIGPAGPGLTVETTRGPTESPRSAPTGPPSLTATAEKSKQPPDTGITLSPDVSVQLGGALFDAEVAWPGQLESRNRPTPWYTFDDRGEAQFDLVNADHARRTVIVTVRLDQSYSSQLCIEYDFGPGCTSWTLYDGTSVHLNATPAADRAPATLRLSATRLDGVVVEVLDTAGSGPPWLGDPLLTKEKLLEVATLPGFDVIR